MNINIYMDDISVISIKEYEKYCNKFDWKIECHPNIKITRQKGFLPIKVEALKLEKLKDKQIMSGFDMFLHKYNDFISSDLIAENENNTNIYKADILKILDKSSNINRNNNIKRKTTKIEVDKNIIEGLKKCNYKIVLSTSASDRIEDILAYYFACFLAENYNAIIYDTSTGEWIKDSAYDKISEKILNEEIIIRKRNDINFRIFDGWK